jgi:O-antigen ligase
MKLIYKSYLTKENYLNFLLSLIPASFIVGNMAININIILLILSSIFFFKKDIFKLKYFFDKLIFIFFSFVIFTGFYNDIYFYNTGHEIYFYFTDVYPQVGYTTLKSLLFLKYLFLYLSIRFLVEKKIINLKYFFYSASFCSLFVCIDLFYQFIFKKDIFGYEIIFARKLSGPFGEELIAGGYLQRFSIFSFFILPLFFVGKSKKITTYITPFLFLFIFVAIVLSGNRIPLLSFLLAISLILIFQKQTRKIFFPFIIIFTLSFSLIYNLNSHVKDNFNSFYTEISSMKEIIISNEFDEKNKTPYIKEFSTFYDTWQMNKFIGGGIKNFRYYCHIRPNINPNSKFICNMHPHNYYLEILTETGLVGLAIILSIFLLTLYYSFFKKYFLQTSLRNNNIIIPFIFLFLVEIFPLKSTGSFFTTGNASYLFFILAILIGLIKRDNLFENNS